MDNRNDAVNPVRCRCPMRDGAHETTCGSVGEYDYIHCKRCDKPVWMASMSFGMCPDCQRETDAWGSFLPISPRTGR